MAIPIEYQNLNFTNPVTTCSLGRKTSPQGLGTECGSGVTLFIYNYPWISTPIWHDLEYFFLIAVHSLNGYWPHALWQWEIWHDLLAVLQGPIRCTIDIGTCQWANKWDININGIRNLFNLEAGFRSSIYCTEYGGTRLFELSRFSFQREILYGARKNNQ